MFVVEMMTVSPPEPGSSRRSSENATARGCRILYVEDHVDTRRVMERLLKHIGCSVVSAGGVQEAMSLAERQSRSTCW